MPKRPRRPEAAIRAILAEQTSGASVGDLVKKHGISSATFYNWKKKFAGEVSAPKKRGRPPKAIAGRPAAVVSGLPSVQTENQRLKAIIGDLVLQAEDLKSKLARR